MSSPIERAIDKACGFNPNESDRLAALVRHGTRLMGQLLGTLDGYYHDRTPENHDALIQAWEAVRAHDVIMADFRRQLRANKGGAK